MTKGWINEILKTQELNVLKALREVLQRNSIFRAKSSSFSLTLWSVVYSFQNSPRPQNREMADESDDQAVKSRAEPGEICLLIKSHLVACFFI